MSFIPIGDWQIHDPAGRRKYVTARERRRFLAAADGLPLERRAFCYVLAYTGFRVSEVLSVARHQLDREACTLTVRTLKRRRATFRTIPIPGWLAKMLNDLPAESDGRYWHMHRSTAWRMVRTTMTAAKIAGPMATCKGLRHGLGIAAATAKVPPNLIGKWLGHASLSTTAIYLDAVGNEERSFAKRLWHEGGD
jgi:integrase